MMQYAKYAIAPMRSAVKKPRDPYLYVMVWQTALCALVLVAAFALSRLQPQRWMEMQDLFSQSLTTDGRVAAQQMTREVQKAAEDVRESLSGLDLSAVQDVISVWGNAQSAGEALSFVSAVVPAQGMGGIASPEGCTYSPVLLSSALEPPLGGSVTSLYGWRTHPITEKEDFHRGIDIAAPLGTPVRAVLPGRVAEVGESPIYGNYIRLEHTGGIETTYSHCERIEAREGENLRKGELLAMAGSTGISTGPHVHFELAVHGVYYDPAWVMNGLMQLGD